MTNKNLHFTSLMICSVSLMCYGGSPEEGAAGKTTPVKSNQARNTAVISNSHESSSVGETGMQPKSGTASKQKADERTVAQQAAPEKKPVEISAEQLKGYIDDGMKFLLIDGRGSPYYERTIPGAVMIMEHQVEDMRHLLPADKNMKIVAFCAGKGCKASERLCMNLMEMGYVNVENFPGGFPDWYYRGYPTVVPGT